MAIDDQVLKAEAQEIAKMANLNDFLLVEFSVIISLNF